MKVPRIDSAKLGLGARFGGNGQCQFRVWAPFAKSIELHRMGPGTSNVYLPMEAKDFGYFELVMEGALPGSLYRYRLDGKREFPDPASRFQPEGVHGPSQVVDSQFAWQDQAWSGLSLQHYLFYELHVGTFTPEGTFEAIIPHLQELAELGISAIELMPVAQFPGTRNWGYDGVYLFAPQNTYGGPEGLKRLVNACHLQGIAVTLDVVYNHLGPEGNYLAEFGPYFTERHKTPWGSAINFDGPYSDEVRQFFLDNALYWITDFHIDALRLDATHAIMDHSARPFLQDLSKVVHRRASELNRHVYLIAENNLNDSRVICPVELGGLGLDAQWNDDFHHSLRTLLKNEQYGYYQDFGEFSHLVKAYREGFVYSGQYSAFRRRKHGNSSVSRPACQFIVFSQNHDQVGNRMLGDRLSTKVSFEELKLAAGAVILSPFIPLFFMGEEYGETAPFQYFVSHSDQRLVADVRKGRKQEFAAFTSEGEPPDPQDEATFFRSQLNHKLRKKGMHQVLSNYYRELIKLRRTHPSLAHLDKDQMELIGFEKEKIVYIGRWDGEEQTVSILNFGDAQRSILIPLSAQCWIKLLDSSDQRWLGSGSTTPERLRSEGEVMLNVNPKSVVLFCNDRGMGSFQGRSRGKEI